MAEDDNKETVLGAFVIPNEPVSFQHKLQDFQVSLEDLERRSGLLFFPAFNLGKASDLCVTDGCKMMSKERMDMIVFGRRLRNAGSLDLLDEVWQNVRESKVTPDKFTVEIYEKRKRELQEQEIKAKKVNEGEENQEGKDEK